VLICHEAVPCRPTANHTVSCHLIPLFSAARKQEWKLSVESMLLSLMAAADHAYWHTSILQTRWHGFSGVSCSLPVCLLLPKNCHYIISWNLVTFCCLFLLQKVNFVDWFIDQKLQ